MDASDSHTFQENKPAVKPPFDPNNQCRRCAISAGIYTDKETNKKVGVYLLVDSRGGKICNLCNDAGYGITPRKLNKKEKRREKEKNREMRKAISSMPKLPHITVDAKGNKVE